MKFDPSCRDLLIFHNLLEIHASCFIGHLWGIICGMLGSHELPGMCWPGILILVFIHVLITLSWLKLSNSRPNLIDLHAGLIIITTTGNHSDHGSKDESCLTKKACSSFARSTSNGKCSIIFLDLIRVIIIMRLRSIKDLIASYLLTLRYLASFHLSFSFYKKFLLWMILGLGQSWNKIWLTDILVKVERSADLLSHTLNVASISHARVHFAWATLFPGSIGVRALNFRYSVDIAEIGLFLKIFLFFFKFKILRQVITKLLYSFD